MSLNWKEISLIVEELPLAGSRIQKIYQLNYHTLIFELYHREAHFWQLYVEIGTARSRIHRISGKKYVNKEMRKGKTQRFNQYLRSHIEGGIIESCVQKGQDRLLIMNIRRQMTTYVLIIRLYSGSKANVIVCDEKFIIQDLMYRRPNQHEISKEQLILPPDRKPSKEFPPRENTTHSTYNEFIESTYLTEHYDEKDLLIQKIHSRYEQQLSRLLKEKEKIDRERSSFSDGSEYKKAADLLSSNIHLISKGAASIRLTSFEGDEIELDLQRKLSPGENIQLYYQKYHKHKARREYLETSADEVNRKILALKETEKDDEELFELSLGELRKLANGDEKKESSMKRMYAHAPGLHFFNGRFDILVGRNVNENDELLRRFTKGNDYWMHTRDYPGGYVFIKAVRNKSIDLETILDAGNLALLFSKAKNLAKADTYFTQVKYLKRVKGGKKGTVLPSNEKNYTIERDEKRIARLFELHKEGEELV